jgi:hypothetical protein
MSFRDELLTALHEELDISPITVAEGMAHVIRGETVEEWYEGDRVVKKRIKRTPQDIMRGAMVYDALRGGDLGLAPREFKAGTQGDVSVVVHKRFSVDNRIVANSPEAMRMIAEDVEYTEFTDDLDSLLNEAMRVQNDH